jgi:uncharacterized membrane protein YedE/YeeE
MLPFDPISAAFGGALIGLASVFLMLLTGRIAGISGILGGLLAFEGADKGWRIAFLAGLVAAPVMGALIGWSLPKPEMPASWVLTGVAGLLVGFGARLGGGCTSGHGVCGLSRRSARALVATCTFMATAVCVVAITRHAIGG